MRDNRFIELVNLDIDRQISAEETAELEAEMQANPKRRAVYRQYCQLHSATKQVYVGFRANASEPRAGKAGGQVVRGEFARRSRAHWVHYAGGLTAAACLAVMFVRSGANSQPGETLMVGPSVQTAVASTAVEPAPADVRAAPPAAVTASLDIPLTAEPNYSDLLKSLRQEDQRAFASGQIQPARIPSLFDDGVFETGGFAPVNNQRTFRGKQLPAQQAAFTAFEFQR